MPYFREGSPAWWLCPLGTGSFLCVSVTVICVELAVFYVVPDDMKSMYPKIWGSPWGLPPQRKTLIKDFNVIWEHPSPNNGIDPVPICGWVNSAAFWDLLRAGALWFLTFEQRGKKDLLESLDSCCGGDSKFRIKWPLHLQRLLRPCSTED